MNKLWQIAHRMKKAWGDTGLPEYLNYLTI